MPTSLFPVSLLSCSTYANIQTLHTTIGTVLDASGFAPAFGSVVLVKPNLLRAHTLTCTNPQVVAGACLWLLDKGVRVVVADSPGFGTAKGVAQFIGLTEALQPLHLSVQAFEDVLPIPLQGLGLTDHSSQIQQNHWGVAKLALEADAILSIPRVKAHAQLRLTLSVKNLFGCVVGLRKALAHTREGHKPGVFPMALVDLLQALPPVAALADGVTAMHKTGPSHGEAFELGCVGASASAVALDTALYALLGAQPNDVPLWLALQQRHIPGSLPEHLVYPLSQPANFDASHFEMPEKLMDISFRPTRLLKSLVKRIWASCKN